MEAVQAAAGSAGAGLQGQKETMIILEVWAGSGSTVQGFLPQSRRVEQEKSGKEARGIGQGQQAGGLGSEPIGN